MLDTVGGGEFLVGQAYRFVTLWVSALRVDMPSLVCSAMEGWSGAEFWVSSREKSMLGGEMLVK